MKDSETSEVISLGAKLKRKHRKIWRRVELDAFEGDPDHIMSRVPKGKNGGGQRVLPSVFRLDSSRRPMEPTVALLALRIHLKKSGTDLRTVGLYHLFLEYLLMELRAMLKSGW